MKSISIDIETFSSVSLQKSGVYRYAESEDFEILLFGYSVDGSEVKVVDLAMGEKIPDDIIDALTDDGVIKWAFNAQFLGWLFGTANIMTNTISFVDLQSYDVIQGHKVKSLGRFMATRELQFSDQAIDYSSPRGLVSILHECILSTEEDYKRIAAAVVRESVHLASDRYCVEGLPIPILSTISPERAQELIGQGWNSLEFKNLLTGDLKQIGASAGLALLINLIIEVIYLFCFETTDDQNLRRVKVKKILSMSDIMASSSNILFVALTKNMAKLDLGGFAVTMITLLHSRDFIKKMKQEYIRNEFEAVVMKNSSEEMV